MNKETIIEGNTELPKETTIRNLENISIKHGDDVQKQNTNDTPKVFCEVLSDQFDYC